MDERDKKILNLIQTDFPVSKTPYKEIACSLDMSEEEVLDRIKNLIDQNIIREIGPVFSSKHLGYKSTLAAMKVPEEKLEETIKIINSFHQVTHNYGRKHNYNLWFTLICSSDEEVNGIIKKIKDKTGINDIYNLPAKKMFKIKVNFEF
jgi:siroheme decarboxylase